MNIGFNDYHGNLKNADGSESDIANIVRGLHRGVGLVISGHTHAAYNCSANTVDVKGVNGAASSRRGRPGCPTAWDSSSPSRAQAPSAAC